MVSLSPVLFESPLHPARVVLEVHVPQRVEPRQLLQQQTGVGEGQAALLVGGVAVAVDLTYFLLAIFWRFF